MKWCVELRCITLMSIYVGMALLTLLYSMPTPFPSFVYVHSAASVWPVVVPYTIPPALSIVHTLLKSLSQPLSGMQWSTLAVYTKSTVPSRDPTQHPTSHGCTDLAKLKP